MRILQVSRVFHPQIGGMERHVEGLARALLGRGHDVEVLTLDRSFADGRRLPASEILGEGSRPLQVHRVPYVGSKRYPIAPRILGRLRDRWDVIHVHGVDFLADAVVATRMWHRTPVVVSTHGGFFHTAFLRAAKQVWFHTATRALVHAADAVVFTSASDRERFARITRRGVVVPNAVDLTQWGAIDPAPEPGRFLTLGRVDAHKGLSSLLRALAALRERDIRQFEVRVVGPEAAPGMIACLQREAEALGVGDRVRWTGALPLADVHREVGATDVALFPSTFESFGVALLEVMAAGGVAVANDIPAFRDRIRSGENGFLVDFGDPVRAAQAIRRARDLGELRGAVSRAARSTSAHYAWDDVVRAMEALYQRVARAP